MYTWPSSISGFIYRKKRVSSSVRMCEPSTSASHMRIILLYRSFSGLKSSPTPAPMAVKMFRISSFSSILWSRAFSTFRILPFIGRIAWNRRSRPCFALPPAESPSTKYISQCSGSLMEQSASFPGRPAPSIAFLRRAISRALRDASRASAARKLLSIIRLASGELFSSQSDNAGPITDSTIALISLLPSFVLVCPSNCGSGTFTLITAVNPSLKSSPVSWILSSFTRLFFDAKVFSERVSAVRNPTRCVPPSCVLILLTYEKTFSEY